MQRAVSTEYAMTRDNERNGVFTHRLPDRPGGQRSSHEASYVTIGRGLPRLYPEQLFVDSVMKRRTGQS